MGPSKCVYVCGGDLTGEGRARGRVQEVVQEAWPGGTAALRDGQPAETVQGVCVHVRVRALIAYFL